MDKVFIKSRLLVNEVSTAHLRGLHSQIDWQDRLICILGARGTGKTTLLLQYLKLSHLPLNEAVYISMDDVHFTKNTLLDFAEDFRQQGGQVLLLDEVHKYDGWSREIKNIYDTYRDLKIVFTGSSIIDIHKQEADLSRRALQYELAGLSFREYLIFKKIGHFEPLLLNDLLKNHEELATSYTQNFKPLVHFTEYLNAGYYPFFIENPKTYLIRVEQVIRFVLENELRFLDGFDLQNVRKIYQLLTILASNVPFKPNISKLSEKIGVSRNTLVQYIYYLEKAKLINTLSVQGKSTSILQKPDKIFLENPNFHQVLAPEKTDKGSLREAFFLNQLKNAGHSISLPAKGDFLVNENLTFEIGGKGKTQKQIQGLTNAYIAADDMEIGIFNKIPLWLFGMLY